MEIPHKTKSEYGHLTVEQLFEQIANECISKFNNLPRYKLIREIKLFILKKYDLNIYTNSLSDVYMNLPILYSLDNKLHFKFKRNKETIVDLESRKILNLYNIPSFELKIDDEFKGRTINEIVSTHASLWDKFVNWVENNKENFTIIFTEYWHKYYNIPSKVIDYKFKNVPFSGKCIFFNVKYTDKSEFIEEFYISPTSTRIEVINDNEFKVPSLIIKKI